MIHAAALPLLRRLAAALARDDGLAPGPAREAAHRELSDPRYHHDPGLLARVLSWLLGRLGDVVEVADRTVPVGPVGILGIAAAIVIAVGLGLRAQGGFRREARARRPLFDADTEFDAAGHRALADAAVSAGDWHAAVLERFRETVRTLEERGALDPRPGRTAAEVADDALVPGITADLRAAVDVFADVVYGGATAGPAAHERVQRAALAARVAPVTSAPAAATTR